jgi:large subunit ribosomal protein L13
MVLVSGFPDPCHSLFPMPQRAHSGAMNKTPQPSADSLDRQWFVVDAADQTLGRLASEVAQVLRGKNKPTFTPHMDTGDFVVIINAEKVRVSGNKPTQKVYRRHSGRPGGMKTETFAHLQARLPERIVEKAIKGMLPHNALGRQLFRKLKVYRGAEHPHAAQRPQNLALNPSASSK